MTEINNTTNTEPAGFWVRLCAHLVDLSLLQVVAWLIFIELSHLFENQRPAIVDQYGFQFWSTSHVFILAFVAAVSFISFLYFFFLEASPVKATLGKFIFGLKVYDQTLGLAGFWNVLGRNLSRIFCVLTLGFGYILVAFARNKQGLHDLIGKTIVISNPYQPGLKSALGILAFISFFLVTYHLPLNETNLLVRSMPEHTKSKTLTASGEDPHTSTIGYLSYPGKTSELSDVYARIDSITPRKTGNSGSNTRLSRIRLAFFEDKLSANDIKALNSENDFFKESYENMGKRAMLVLSISYPENLLRCDYSRIQIASVALNPALFPHASLQTKNLIHRLDVSSLHFDNKLFTNCKPSLSPDSDVDVRFQDTLPSIFDSPEIFINLAAETKLNVAAISQARELNNMGSAVALWYPSQELLELAFYQNELSAQVIARIFSAKSLEQEFLPKPAMRVKFNHSRQGQLFARDLVNNYSIEFFKQTTGPLAFKDDREKLEVSFKGPNEIPHSLSGRMKTSERLIGRLSGKQRVRSESGSFNFQWNLPFNAPVLVVE